MTSSELLVDPFSRRLLAMARRTGWGLGVDSKTQKEISQERMLEAKGER